MPERIFFTRDSKFAVTAAHDGKPTTLAGYAIVWNTLSSDRGGYHVRLLPGSAKFTTPALALYGHDYGQVLGRTDNGTLRVSPDEIGVRVEIDLPDTTTGRDVAALVKRRDVTGMSFSMVSGPEKFTTASENGQQVMSVESFTVDEVTVTSNPAFRDTTIDHKPDALAPAYHDARAERQRFEAFRLI